MHVEAPELMLIIFGILQNIKNDGAEIEEEKKTRNHN